MSSARKRLIHEQDLRIQDEHLREGHALAHSARELVGVALSESGEANPREPLLASGECFRARHAAKLQSRDDIFDGVPPGHERFCLEHVARSRVDAGKPRSKDRHRAGRRLEQAGGDVEQRRLAASRRPDHGNELALGHAKGGVANAVYRSDESSRELNVHSICSSARAGGMTGEVYREI